MIAPSAVLEALSAAVTLMRDHPLRLTLSYAIVSVFVVTERIVLWQLTSGAQSPTAWGLLLDLGGTFLQTIGGVAVIAQTRTLMHNEPLSLAATFRHVARRLVPLLALFVLWVITLLLAALPGCITGGIAAAADAPQWLVILLGLATGLPPVLYVMARLGVVLQAFTLSGAGPTEAIGESWRVTKGHVWRLLGIILVVGVATGAVQFGLGEVLSLANGVVQIIGTGLVAIPFEVFSVVALTLYYLRAISAQQALSGS